MRIYWAGAAYWLQADLALRRRGGSLDAVLARYARCCLDGNAQLSSLAFARVLDRIDGHGLFERLHREYAAATHFPDLADSYGALGLDTRNGRLVFDDDPDTARRRAAGRGGD
jgi:predicted metalloprotease with PDZ domain